LILKKREITVRAGWPDSIMVTKASHFWFKKKSRENVKTFEKHTSGKKI
jgi:hypothetical protein